MADTRITALELTREFLAVFHSNTIIVKNLNHDYEKYFGDNQRGFDGQKIGPTLNIREPVQTTVRKVWTMTQQDVTETYIPLTIDQVAGIDLKFSDADLALSIDDFRPRYIEVPSKKLAATVDQDVAAFMKNQIWNSTDATNFAIPTTIDTYLGASALMKNALVPMEQGINVAIDPFAEQKIVSGLSGQYNPQGLISEIFEKGQMAKAAGLDWYMSQVLPNHTRSTADASCTLASWSSAAPGTLVITTGTSGAIAKQGDVLTIDGVYDVNYETKGTYSNLRQFVVTADATGVSTALTVTVAQAPVSSGPFQNVSADPTAGNAVKFLGAVSTSYPQELLWVKDSFAFASVPLLVPRNMDMAANVSMENLNFRFIRGYDIANARMLSRMDIFYGRAALRPAWAARIWHV